MIEESMKLMATQDFHKQGCTPMEAAKIQQRLKDGETPAQISNSMRIAIECVESFVGFGETYTGGGGGTTEFKDGEIPGSKGQTAAAEPFAGMKAEAKGKGKGK